jgi:hypothetical protein
MSNIITSLAKIAASKVVGALISFAAAIGFVVPLDENTTLTAAFTLVIAAVLQLLWQITMVLAEKIWPNIANVRPLVLRFQLRDYTVRNIRSVH